MNVVSIQSTKYTVTTLRYVIVMNKSEIMQRILNYLSHRLNLYNKDNINKNIHQLRGDELLRHSSFA